METATPTANGNGDVAPAASVLDALDQIKARARAEMEELLGPLSARRAQLEAELGEVTDEIEDIQRSVAALDGRLPTSPAPKKKKSQTHTTSQKTMDDVYAVIAKAQRSGRPDVITSEIADATGLSRSTVMEACRRLREEERIRIVGTRKDSEDERTGGRGSNAYAVMTNG